MRRQVCEKKKNPICSHRANTVKLHSLTNQLISYGRCVEFLIGKKKGAARTCLCLSKNLPTDITTYFYSNSLLCPLHPVYIQLKDPKIEDILLAISPHVFIDHSGLQGICPLGFCLKTHLSPDLKGKRKLPTKALACPLQEHTHNDCMS